MLRLILLFLLITNLQVFNIYTSDETNLSSTSCSSNSIIFLNLNNTKETNFSKHLSKHQKEILEKLDKEMDQLREFPPGIKPLISGYASVKSPKEATKDLIDIIKRRNINEEDRINFVKEALQDGAEVNSDDYFLNPLIKAITISNDFPDLKPNYEVINILIEANANVNAQYKISWTNSPGKKERGLIIHPNPLIDAIFAYNLHLNHRPVLIKIIELLLQNNANPNLIYSNEMTPLILASQHEEIIRLLLKFHANPFIGRNYHGETFLEIAKKNAEIQKIYEEYKE